MTDVRKMQQAPQPHAVDLFCGAGGLSYGMMKAGIRILGGIDCDSSCKYPFETNVRAPFYNYDIFDITPDFVASLYPIGCPTILSGCAPCQPYSTYTNGPAHRQPARQPLDKFAEIIHELRPEIVTMENVSLLTRFPIFEAFLHSLGRSGYKCTYSVVRCSDYGVPQRRKRLVLLASLRGYINLCPPTTTDSQPPTVRDSIRHLEKLEAGEASSTDTLHKASGLSETNLRRIQSSKPGGTWRDWDEALRSKCHTKNSGQTYSSVYGRMDWDQPAPTITTQFHGYGNGRFGHPEQDRAISLREGALLQTFPADYSFTPQGHAVPIGPVARLIGNAVPVKLGEAIGESILSHLRQCR